MTINLNDASRAKSFAHVMRDGLRDELRYDVPLKTCLDAVARGLESPDWKTVSKSKEWPRVLNCDLAAGCLAHDAGLPPRIISATIAGLAPLPTNHELGKTVADMLSGQAGQELGTLALAKRAGALVLAPGIGDLALFLSTSEEIERIGFDEQDPRTSGLAVLTLAYWSRIVEMGNAQDGELERTDFIDVARRMRRGIDSGNVQMIDDAIVQMPPCIKDVFDLMIIEIAEAVADRIKTIVPSRGKENANYIEVPIEEHASDMFTQNWGSHWRRLDAPDLVIMAKATDMLFPGCWLRIATSFDDADIITLGITPDDIAGGEQGLDNNGDGDNAIWILGLGSSRQNIAPIAAMHFSRGLRIDEGIGDGSRLDEEYYEIFCKELKNEGGRLKDQVSLTLAHLVVSQSADDVNGIMVGSVDAEINIDLGIRVWPHVYPQEDMLQAAIFQNFLGLATAINSKFQDIIILLDAHGNEVDLPNYQEPKARDGMPQFDHIAIASQLGTNPWGATAIILATGEMSIAPIMPPSGVISAETRQALNKIEAAARAHAITTPEEAIAAMRIMTAGYDAIELCKGRPSAGSLELELTRHKARVAVFTLPEDGDGISVESGTYASPKPGQSVSEALIELIEVVVSEGPETAIAVQRDGDWKENDDGSVSIPLNADLTQGLHDMNDAFEAMTGIKKKAGDPLFAKGVDKNGKVLPMEQIPVAIDNHPQPVMAVMALVGMNTANHAKARAIEDILMEELDLDERPEAQPVKMNGRRQFIMMPGAVSTQTLANAGQRIVSTKGIEFVDLMAMDMMSMMPITVTVEPGAAPHAYHIG